VESTALRTDHYELTMLDAARRSGIASHRSVFEVFARELPVGRRYGVVAGTGRLADAIARFRFDAGALAHLAAAQVVSEETRAWLADYRFAGDVSGYPEGETYFPGSPVARVEGTFGETVLLETLVLSILNHDTAVASAAARMSVAARSAQLIDMGGRRTHEDAAVDAARAAYVAGFHATSNLEAGRRYGIPTAGTAAHAFVLAHDEEATAFAAQLRALGGDTTLLVDTFDTETGIRNAVAASRALGFDGPGAIRVDSGNLPEEARRARALLDELDSTRTRIVVSGDLDEYVIDALESEPGGRAPIDAYGVGTRLVTGSGHPTAGFVYKLVAIADTPDAGAALRPVSKSSPGKETFGHRKTAFRVLDAGGHATAELLTIGEVGPPGARPLQRPVIRRGEPCPGSLEAARDHHLMARAELPPRALDLGPGEPALWAVLHEGSLR
jgi:nicotinate phosphoribosyltransferase